jgi:hypothetical protein
MDQLFGSLSQLITLFVTRKIFQHQKPGGAVLFDLLLRDRHEFI